MSPKGKVSNLRQLEKQLLASDKHDYISELLLAETKWRIFLSEEN